MKLIFKALIFLFFTTFYSCKTDYAGLSKEINSNLILASKIDNKTGDLIDINNSFIIMNDGKVEAKLDLSTYFADVEKQLLIHLDWVDEKGNSFYKKSMMLSKETPIMNSAISISPELRQKGDYTLNVYVFRELMYSKKFILLPIFKLASSIKETIKLDIKANKKTTKLKTYKPKINQMNDKWLTASVKLKNKPKTNQKNLLYQLNWVDKNGEIFYKKRFSIPSKKKKNKLSCAIEVSSEKKETGNYKVQLLLFGNLISEKEFEIKPALDVNKIKVNSLLEDTTKTVDYGAFTINDDNKLKATFNIENCLVFGKNKQLNFKISWVGTNGKHFYNKRFNFTPTENTKSLKSSISISAKKRKVGNYKVQLYLFNELISEKEFKLKKSTKN